MGSVTYNFLADSILFHERNISENFKNISNERIERELFDYRQHCIKNYDLLLKEIKDKNSLLSVFSSASETPINLLTQTALYFDQYIISDPLFTLTDRRSDMTKVMSEYLGYDNSEEIDRQKLTNIATFLKKITPMVAGNFVKVFPLSYHFEGPKDSVPFNMPIDYYNGVLPTEILDFFWENVDVKSMKKEENGNGWYVENELYPCRGIVVDFKGTNFSSSMMYHLFEMEVRDFDEKNNKATISHYLPDTAPSIEYFNAWVRQSINSASKAYFDRVFFENYLAAKFNCTYLCDNPFKANLISNTFEVKDSIQTFTANQLMNFDLPFIENIDIEKLMSIRHFEEDTFTLFRVELEKHLRELRSISDEKQLKLKLENAFHELNSVQVQKINQKVQLFQRQMKSSAIVAFAGLAGSVSTGGYSVLLAAAALAKGYKDYLDYREKVRENPAYLLWKVRRSK